MENIDREDFIDVYVLKETVFWITGAFNYILPITISILA